MGYMDADELDEGTEEGAAEGTDSTTAEEQPQEAQPADSKPEGEQTGSEAPFTGKEAKKDEQAAPAAGEFDLGGGQKIKGLSPEQIKSLEGGFLRNKDYTQKLQKFHSEYKRFEGVVQAAQQNPLELRKYFSPAHLRAALGEQATPQTPHQPVQGDGKDEFAQFEPEAANILRSYKQEISGLKEQLGQALGQINQFGQKFETADQQQAQQALDSEVGQAMTQFPVLNQGQYKDYNRQLILMKIAANPNRSALEIAHEIAETWASGATPTATPASTKVIGPGASVPLAPKRPKTMEEADRQAHARLGARFIP